jgi:hypothetical protein
MAHPSALDPLGRHAARSRASTRPPTSQSPVAFSLGEGLDVGMDVGSPVDFTYTLPFAFTGTIEKVEIDLKPERIGAAKAA